MENNAKIVRSSDFHLSVVYPDLVCFLHLLSSVDGEQADAQYTDRIVLSIIVPQEQSQKFKSRIIETFNATVTPRQTGTSNRPVRY